jgi:hypothetical protein
VVENAVISVGNRHTKESDKIRHYKQKGQTNYSINAD